jgi:hypothetical protein
MATVEVDPGWIDYLREKIDQFFDERLGPDISSDAVALCPKRTGALARSIGYHLNDHTLVIFATGSDERWYAAWLELGHRLVAWGRQTDEFVAPRPFMRPALYMARTY